MHDWIIFAKAILVRFIRAILAQASTSFPPSKFMLQLLLSEDPLLKEAEYKICSPVSFSCPTQEQTEDHRKELLASLRGQKIRVPNLKPIFEHWPTKTNDCLKEMDKDIRRWLDE